MDLNLDMTCNKQNLTPKDRYEKEKDGISKKLTFNFL
jgi:hypothetical protein